MRQSSLLHLPLIFSLFILRCLSQSQKHLSKGDEAVAEAEHDGDRIHGAGSSDWASNEGNADVQKALAELRILQTSGTRLSRLDKRSGVVGTTAYYAKKGFVFLFMNGPSSNDYMSTETGPRKLSGPLSKAVSHLETAAKARDPDALFLLAEMNFYGNYSHPRNYSEAFRLYEELADLTGNSTAQYMLGFMYSTGHGGAVERNQAKAMLYHAFAAEAGNIRSQMTMAYRHYSGIGAPRSCKDASYWYKKVADRAVEYSRSGPPGGLHLIKESYRIADEHGGVYGEGASWSSSGRNANKGGPSSNEYADFDDVMEYFDLMSKKGDIKATFSLGKIHYEGSRTMRRNFQKARKYFTIVVRQYWDKHDKIISSDNMGLGKVAAKAAAYMGQFFLRGEGVQQDFIKARRWFELGLKNGDAFCQYSIGLMYLHGLGVRKDVIVASQYLKESASHDWPAAQVELAKLYLDQGDLKVAISYFEVARRHSHLEAFYHLAEISKFGVGRERQCDLAVAFYKIVVERVEALHSSFEEANRAYDDGDRETALTNFLMAAEQGYEPAQANVAYMLDEQKSIFSLDALLPWKSKVSDILRNGALALIFWTRSAKQANIDSMVKMGDYYLQGYGVEVDVEKAVACYQAAVEMPQSAQALWNLGWMHENGIGVEQDFHLAKRFYDQALEVNDESYLPVKLALLKLRARSWWNTITHGGVNSIQPEPEEERRFSTWSEWFANFYKDEDDGWHSTRQPVEDDLYDPIPGGDDYYYEDINADLLETLLIIALAGALAFLVYYRQIRQQVHQRNGQPAPGAEGGMAADDAGGVDEGGPLPGQQPDGGFFPPPDDPNFDVWRAGGVGH